MRLKAGKWLLGSGLVIAGLGSVPAALGAPVVAWIVFIAGLALSITGGVFALLGPTAEERETARLKLRVELDALDDEREQLDARRLKIESEKQTQAYWEKVATDYGDHLRVAQIKAAKAELDAEERQIVKRIGRLNNRRDLA